MQSVKEVDTAAAPAEAQSPSALPGAITPAPADGAPALHKAITLRHAIALYVSSVLGSGVLVLPGLAAQIAGPASLVAWVVLSIASYPFAYTFATMSARNPQSGGVYAFAREAFGRPMAAAVGWLFALWHVFGAPAVTLIAASYLSYAFPISKTAIDLVAFVVILGPYLINLRGIAMSSRVQVAVIVAILALLALAVVFSAPAVQAARFTPFAPKGWLPVGAAAALIFWSFLGYENVSNVAEEFKNPRRDFGRSILLSVVVIGVMYTGLAVVTVGSGAYAAGGSVAPFAVMLSRVFGPYGAAGTALLAVAIIFGVVNAYTAGMSRVVLAVARDGLFPSAFARVSRRTGAPAGSLTFLTGLDVVVLVGYVVFDVDLTTALLIPSGAAILIYVIGSAAGIKLLPDRGPRRALPWLSLVISVVVLPFVGPLALVALGVGTAAFLYGLLRRRAGRDAQGANGDAQRAG
ncbi:MAG TPA: amino acid permease [Spirochaetia bacterium]